MSCEIDRDCPGTTVCYSGFPIGEVEPCQCEFWHGWKGDDCLDYGTGAQVNLVLTSIQVVLIVLILFSSFTLVFKLLETERTFFTLPVGIYSLTVCGLLGLLTWRSLTLRIVTSPERVTLFATRSNGDEEKFHELAEYEAASIAILVATAPLCLINISIFWIANAIKATGTFVKYQYRIKKLKVLTKGLYALQFIFLATSIGLLTFNSALTGIFAMCFAIILGPLLFMGYFYIIQMMDFNLESSATQKTNLRVEIQKIKNMRKNIQRAAMGFLGCYVMFLILILIFVIVGLANGGWKYYASEDHASPNMLSLELISLNFTIFFAIVAYYLYTVLDEVQSSSSTFESIHNSEHSESVHENMKDDKNKTGHAVEDFVDTAESLQVEDI